MQASHVPSSGLKDERIRACDEQSAGQTVPGLLPAPGTDLTLKTLRARIAASSIPPSQLDESITLATWNIREFGKRPRLPASLHYIAEIIGCFDLVSVVELRDNLADLHTVLRYLGPTWKAIFSDFLTDSGGNRERMAFLYDSRAVQFTGLASNAISTRKKDRAGNYRSPGGALPSSLPSAPAKVGPTPGRGSGTRSEGGSPALFDHTRPSERRVTRPKCRISGAGEAGHPPFLTIRDHQEGGSPAPSP